MTYLETLYAGIESIAKRHNELKGINTKLAEYVEGDWKEFGPCTCEHWIIESDAPNIEMRLDFKSLCFELNLEFNAINNGFMIVNRNPKVWNAKYRDKEFIADDSIYPNMELPLAFWRCSDEFFKNRYKRFDAVINFYKNKNKTDGKDN